MERDYYAFRQAQLSNSLSELEQAAVQLDQAKDQKDKNARQQAEGKMKQTANKAVKIEPHLAYLLFWADKEDADKNTKNVTGKVQKKAGEERAKRASEIANSIRDAWQKSLAASAIPEAFRLMPDITAVVHMPPLSFLVHVPFRLQKPYLSKNERDFYILDNPLRKEKIFQMPMVAATGWKGALRAALWQLGYKEDHEVILRLFGNPRRSEEGQAGRLYFYATFFDKISLEVINPHNRATGVGERGPILMECVPQETTGDLVMLYVPFGPIEQSEDERCAEVAQDLAVLTEGIQAMLTTYGFGAKTSSGFGTVEDRLAGKGTLALRAELTDLAASTGAASEPEQRAPGLPRYLESRTRLHDDFRQPDGSLKSEAEYEVFVKSRGGQYTKKDKQLYEKAQKWWEREGRQLAEATAQEPTPEPAQTPPVTKMDFDTLSKLRDLAKDVATHLRNGGEA
jgi:CRISPR-associated protein Cmr2